MSSTRCAARLATSRSPLSGGPPSISTRLPAGETISAESPCPISKKVTLSSAAPARPDIASSPLSSSHSARRLQTEPAQRTLRPDTEQRDQREHNTPPHYKKPTPSHNRN